jgi:predicted dehydrogenase
MTVRVGFIGVGGMAEEHIKRLQTLEDVSITALFDLNQARSQEAAARCNAVSYESSEQLLDSGSVDALFICTPPFARSGIEAAAARKGIHILAEKPVGLDMKEVWENERIIRESGIINSTGYCLRYMDIVAKAKAYLADKQIGMVMAYRFGGMPGVRWWRMQEQSGGQLVEQSTHQLDLIRYLAGDFKEVSAIHEQRYMRQFDAEATAYDVGTVNFVLQSGAVGNITSTCLGKYVSRNAVEFYGHDFFLSIDGATLRIADDSQDITEKCKLQFYHEQDKAFIEAVRTGNQQLVLADYTEAARTLEVTLAANESAATRKTVIL